MSKPVPKPAEPFPFPECDKDGTPKEKLPDCPRCEEDELGMITPGQLFCYKCGWRWRLNDTMDPYPAKPTL